MSIAAKEIDKTNRFVTLGFLDYNTNKTEEQSHPSKPSLFHR